MTDNPHLDDFLKRAEALPGIGKSILRAALAGLLVTVPDLPESIPLGRATVRQLGQIVVLRLNGKLASYDDPEIEAADNETLEMVLMAALDSGGKPDEPVRDVLKRAGLT